MKIEEILNELAKPGNTVAKVAKNQAGIGEKKLRAALIAAGYEFRNSGQKGWYYIGEGHEPLKNSISDYITVSNTAARSTSLQNNNKADLDSSTVSHNSNTKKIHSDKVSEPQFTPEEVAALKSMLQEYITEKNNQTDRDRLHTRIMKLEKDGRTRKTVLMSETVGKRFDDFAEKMKFNKSDILELALIDFISSYEGEE